MAAFTIANGKNHFQKNVKKFFSYYYYTFKEIPSLNDEVLEALINSTLKTMRNDVEWVQGAQEPWDICLTNLDKRIQVKGTKITGKDLHLFSFRLSKDIRNNCHKSKIKILKTKIDSLLNEIDVWHIVTREMIDSDKIKITYFECNKNSFFYNKDNYMFKNVKKKKRVTYECQSLNKNIKTGIIPSMGNILWYKINFDKFKKMKGVKEAFSFVIDLQKLPKIINL